MLLRREGWHVNPKRDFWIYRGEGLNLRHKRPLRSVAAAHRMKRPDLSSIDQCWSIDFVVADLINGRWIKALTVVDSLSRECLAFHVKKTIKVRDIVTVMVRKLEERVNEQMMRVSEMTSQNIGLQQKLEEANRAHIKTLETIQRQTEEAPADESEREKEGKPRGIEKRSGKASHPS